MGKIVVAQGQGSGLAGAPPVDYRLFGRRYVAATAHVPGSGQSCGKHVSKSVKTCHSSGDHDKTRMSDWGYCQCASAAGSR